MFNVHALTQIIYYIQICQLLTEICNCHHVPQLCELRRYFEYFKYNTGIYRTQFRSTCLCYIEKGKKYHYMVEKSQEEIQIKSVNIFRL